MGNGRRFRRRNGSERPPWEVVLVGAHVGDHCSDLECSERHDLPPGAEPSVDFGYTVGLDEFDLPELHLSAYPSEGNEPPLDAVQLGSALNRLAADCVSGDLEAGVEAESRLCEHRLAVFVLGQPGPLEAVSAFQCSDGAECIPVLWHVEDVEPVAS